MNLRPLFPTLLCLLTTTLLPAPLLAQSAPSRQQAVDATPSVPSSSPLTPKQRWQAMLDSLNLAIKAHPRSTDLRLKKAAVNIELGQWDYATEEYGRVLSLDPDNPAARYYRAYAYSHQRLYSLAKDDYEQFLLNTPIHLQARLGLAYVCEKMGRTTDATDAYNQLVEMFPDSAVVYAARAAFETAQRQYDIALYDWDEALRRQPANADYIIAKADVLLAIGRKDDARRLIDDAIRQGIAPALLIAYRRQLS